MGHTGAGKSTILKLVEKFYQPRSGAVKINGKEISNLQLNQFALDLDLSKTPSYFWNNSGKCSLCKEVSDEEVISSLKTGVGICFRTRRGHGFHGR